MKYLDLLELEKEFVPEIALDSLDNYLSSAQLNAIPDYFLKSMVLLGKIFQKEITYYLVLVYWEFLKRFPADKIRNAFEVVIAQTREFPAPIDFWIEIPE